eukprot:COSAG06_NODE_2854_length_6170_cov_10.221216_7_plen_123_part_00
MPVPREFLPENVEHNSPLEEQLYTKQLRTPYPRKSFDEQGYVFRPSESGDENGVDLEDGTLYYNTATDDKAAYWAEHGPLPSPTKDIHQMRTHLREFGVSTATRALPHVHCHTCTATRAFFF